MKHSDYFYAMLHRMRLIKRWSLMRNTEVENIQEHSLEVAYLAHALALLRKHFFSDGRVEVSPERCVMLALYHDASEIITGDLPTPVKYFNPVLRDAFAEMEEEAGQLMLAGIPEPLQKDYAPLLLPAEEGESEEWTEARKIVKAADTLSAYIKCMDELAVGNDEFKDAAQSTREKLSSYDLPELDWFIEHTLPAYGETLDSLKQQYGH